MKKRLAALALILAGCPLLAQADDPFYVGVGLGTAHVTSSPEGGLASQSGSDNETSGSIFAGYQFNRYVAAEVAYVNSGTFSQNLQITGSNPYGYNASDKLETWSLAAVGSWPVASQLALTGKLGIAETRLKQSLQYTSFFGPSYVTNNTGTKSGAIVGIGLLYSPVPHIGVGLNWDYYGTISDQSPASLKEDVLTVSLRYSF